MTTTSHSSDPDARQNQRRASDASPSDSTSATAPARESRRPSTPPKTASASHAPSAPAPTYPSSSPSEARRTSLATSVATGPHQPRHAGLAIGLQAGDDAIDVGSRPVLGQLPFRVEAVDEQ